MAHLDARPPRRVVSSVAALCLATLAVAWSPALAAGPADRSAVVGSAVTALSASTEAETKPTVVLVHGAFADASGWNDVIAELQRRGYPVLAPPNPLRGLMSDAEYLAAFLSTLEGPIVLVGHSYGGAVITNAATGNPNVEALVYIAAYALDQGENVAAANELGGGHSDLLNHIVVRPFPGAAPGDADVYVAADAFRDIFAQDLSRTQTAVMAAGQRPGSFSALVTPSGPPAWADIPSWYLVSSEDHLIPPQAQRVMAERAGAHTSEVDSSHVSMMSHPRRVANLIVSADNHT
jgi:pimeloyl-ACP methyl ester carboxylesterase